MYTVSPRSEKSGGESMMIYASLRYVFLLYMVDG